MKNKKIFVPINSFILGGRSLIKTELTRHLEKQNVEIEIVDNNHEIKNTMREQYLRTNEALEPIASFVKNSKNYFDTPKSKFHK